MSFGPRITADTLHQAADIVGKLEDGDEIMQGLTDALVEFIDQTKWHAENPDGPLMDLAPLSLVMGVSIGLVAGLQWNEHEAGHPNG